MAVPKPITLLNEGTLNQTAKSIIEWYVSALKELLKEPHNRDIIKPMLLYFDDIQDVRNEEIEGDLKGKTKVDEDLSKPFKEVLKWLFTRRIVKFSSPGHRMPANAKIYDGTGDQEDHVGRLVGMGNQGEWPMPVWCRMFLQTLDGKTRAWVDKLPPGSINNWGSLQEKFLNRFGMPKACDKDPTKILKKVRRANETLPHFKKRWVSESNVIPNVPELMQISSFMSLHKCPELAQRFLDNIPKMWDDMLKRVDDYLRSKEAFRSTELPIDLSEEALVVEDEVEGYLIRRIHIDEGASVEIMFKQCFNMLHPSIQARLVEMQTTVSGFSREQVKPLAKIELDVCFGGSGLYQRVIMKFTIILAPSPYNIILGRSCLKQLRTIPSTIHGMMKFPNLWGIATMVSQAPIIFECRREGKKQAVEQSEETKPQEKTRKIPHLDIKPSLGQEGIRKLKDMYRLQEHQFLMSEGLLPVTRDRQQDRASCGLSTQVLPRCIQGLRPVDEAFQSQIGQNLEVYVDDMVVKSKSKRELLADIAETFDNLKRINMKLNPKKCSFVVEKGKFLGYMVTSKGIRANPEKIKDIAEMQLPKIWGDMQSLAGKLAALNHFLSRSSEKSLPFFETLKDITKTLHDAKRNYAPLEKMALTLQHISRRLKRYFEAHPITIITDQPIKQILKKADTSGQLYHSGNPHGSMQHASEGKSEAFILVETGTPTHRTMMIKEGEGNEEEIRLNLDLLTERREATAIKEAIYKRKMEQHYNKGCGMYPLGWENMYTRRTKQSGWKI
nr:reverse transcriptase domain-containing protein [Tanacetum cinerariifolium]